MKFEREIPIGLDARRKKRQGGLKKPPPMGLGLSRSSIPAVRDFTLMMCDNLLHSRYLPNCSGAAADVLSLPNMMKESL